LSLKISFALHLKIKIYFCKAELPGRV